MMELELLRSFVAVADCGGFHRAAEQLNLTQSTVSQQIKRLELEDQEIVVSSHDADSGLDRRWRDAAGRRAPSAAA
jgi:DNA-binding MarR family transcriptional regulator